MTRAVRLALPLLLLAPLPSAAAPVTPPPPACAVFNWRDGDSCLFSAPAGAFVFGGVATSPGDQRDAEVAVQIRLRDVPEPLDSCYQRRNGVPAACEDMFDAPVDGLVTYVCQAFGTGGPKFHCADPLRLPMVAGV